MLAAHLKRSRESLLDVTIIVEYPTLCALLSTVVSSVHRWRRLKINLWRADIRHIQFLFDQFNSLYFPSLRRASIFNGCGAFQIRYPDFLLPQRSPALEHLETSEPLTLDSSLASSELKRLSVWWCTRTSMLSFLTSQKLTYVEIRLLDPLPSAAPDSIYLPFLTFLSVRCPDIRKVLEAIVAPLLTHFAFWEDRNCDLPTKVFDGLEHKLINVRHLVTLDLSSTEIAKELCSLLPNVCTMEMSPYAVDHFFHYRGCYWDGLDHLRCLIIDCHFWSNSSLESVMVSRFGLWLQQRRLEGRPPIHVKFFACSHPKRPQGFEAAYDTMRQLCISELIWEEPPRWDERLYSYNSEYGRCVLLTLCYGCMADFLLPQALQVVLCVIR
ncbi:hypothetical protein EDC04DRAFT_158782, partial [Pisolithus marmoratus]